MSRLLKSSSLSPLSQRRKPSVHKGENVQVCVRVRPLSDSELRRNDAAIWMVQSGSPGECSMSEDWRERLKKAPGSTDYRFDKVFSGSDNSEVYESSVKQLVHSAMNGFNSTVFAYGQTASGKSYTMTGTQLQPGVIPQSIGDVFDFIKNSSNQREYLLRVSYIEIYNEVIKDLLQPDHVDLKIHEDKSRGVYITPLKEEVVTSARQVVDLIAEGEQNRHISSTDYNEHSSRSHTIFQFVIESRERTPGSPAVVRAGSAKSLKSSGGSVRISTLNLIDLAGSEKASNSAERRREGAFINRSLLTLGTVISKLTDSKASHIPYRDSKLTRILQPSLQGNARVSVICTISPAANNQEESTNTLKFAQRIKKIVTSAEQTEVVDDKALLQQYKKEIEDLRIQLTQVNNAELPEFAVERQRLKEELHQQQLVRAALKDRIDNLTKLILTSSSINTSNPAIQDERRLSKDMLTILREENSELKLKVQDLQNQVLQLTSGAQVDNVAQVRITALEQEIESLKLKSPIDSTDYYGYQLTDETMLLDQDRYNDALRDAEEAKGRVASLESQLQEANQKITELTAQQKESPQLQRGVQKVFKSQSPPISPPLLHIDTNSHSERRIRSTDTSQADALIQQLESSLNQERLKRNTVENRTSEQIADLETELTMTRAELSVSQMLQQSLASQPVAQINKPLPAVTKNTQAEASRLLAMNRHK